jgi:CRISPR/Cas system-associated exonuclease Cas4 (RecB family)
VPLACGIALRGSIDLVERDAGGALRVTDHKTGKARLEEGAVIDGGKALQPVLYALAVERIMEARVVAGRLYYCTAAGGFTEREIALDEEARAAAQVVAETIGGALSEGFLPAAPAGGACDWCDYRVVCGIHEEQRTARKARGPLASLERLRDTP